MRLFFLLGLILAVAAIAGCGGGAEDTAETTDQAVAEKGGSSLPESHEAEMPAEEENPIVKRSLAKDPGPVGEYVVMKTTMGTIKLRLFPKQAPLAVANFKGLVAQGYYDGIVFHRVIEGFMIQGGDPSGTGFQGQSIWGEKFKDEFYPSLRFDREGLLAMANSGPNTNGSQFFITQGPATHLNDVHTIFGEVMEGMDVINAIGAVRVDKRHKPVKPVVMESLTLETGSS